MLAVATLALVTFSFSNYVYLGKITNFVKVSLWDIKLIRWRRYNRFLCISVLRPNVINSLSQASEK
jgi:hypothetical protein